MAVSTILAVIPIYGFYSDCITFVIGIIGNLLNLLIFFNLKCFRDQRVIFYFIIETISFSLNRIVCLIFNTSTYIYQNDLASKSIVWCRFRYIALQFTALLGFNMLCVAAADQYCTINYQLSRRQLCRFKLVQWIVAILISFWFLHSILFAFYLDIQPSSGCVIWSVIWTHYSTYFFYPGLVGFFPIAIASLFSLLAYRDVRRIVRRQIPIERRRFDRQITAMILVRVMFFAILVIPFSSYRIYAINTTYYKVNALESAIGRLVQAVVNTLLYIHYGISFYLFIWISPRYRRQVKQILRKKIWLLWKDWCRVKPNQIMPQHGASVDVGVGVGE